MAGAMAGTASDVTLVGDLELHGVKKQVSIPAQAQLVNGTISVAGSLAFPLSDFDITVGMIRYGSTGPSVWAGTRGYVGPVIGLGGALGFVVTGGEITSLLGELHSFLDLPCLNFDAYRGAGNWIGYGNGDRRRKDSTTRCARRRRRN